MKQNKKTEERDNPMYTHWRGKGQIYFTSNAYLLWKPTPWTEATHRGSKPEVSVR